MSRRDPIKVLIVSSEIVPFAKTGGLADVVGSLPRELRGLGVEVKLAMPKYSAVKDITERILEPVKIAIGEKSETADFSVANLPETEIEVYFIGNESYFGREELYRDKDTGEDYADNDERFIFFSRAIFSLIENLGWIPDVIHCNDWQTGLIPAYIKTLYRENPLFRGIATLYTIHNMAYQGNFPLETLSKTGLGSDFFYPTGPLEFWGKVSFTKTGLVYSDVLNTVSETYAGEIQGSSEYGYGMEGILRTRKDDLFGIINGVDYSIWNPETDDLIPHNYNKDDFSGKLKDKKYLLEKYNLPARARRTPLIGMVSRLADQKGFDIFAEAIDDIMSFDLQFILLGTGEKKYHKLFTKIASDYPKKFGVKLTFDNALAHQIEAGADMFLMPSKYEPCGLNQLYSLKYGTIPIVRATGGLADTVIDYNPSTDTGTGFVFKEYSPSALLQIIERSISIFSNKGVWTRLMHRDMEEDFSWMVSAEKYLNLYRIAIEKRRKS